MPFGKQAVPSHCLAIPTLARLVDDDSLGAGRTGRTRRPVFGRKACSQENLRLRLKQDEEPLQGCDGLTIEKGCWLTNGARAAKALFNRSAPTHAVHLFVFDTGQKTPGRI